MKTKGNFRFFKDSRGKYLERIEKDNSVIYYRFFNEVTKETTENIPVWGKQEFEDMWNHIPRTM